MARDAGSARAALQTFGAARPRTMATQAKRGRVSCRWLVPGAPLSPAPRAAPPAVGPAKGPLPLPPSGHLRLSGPPSPTQSSSSARAAISPAPSGLSGAGPPHCARLSQVAGPVGGGDSDLDPVASFLSWCRRVGLELSPKVSGSGNGGAAGGGAEGRGADQL